MKLTTILRRLDIFGVPITFIGFNRLKYQTKLGGLVSLGLVGWLSYNIILQFISLITQNKLVVTTNTIFNDIPTQIQLDNENFMFAIQIGQTNYVNNPYFTFVLEHITIIDGTNSTTEQIPLTKCTLDDFSSLYFYNKAIQESLTFNNFSDWVCPQFNNKSYLIQGKYGSALFQYLRVSVSPCQTGQYQYNYTCPSYSEIVEYVGTVNDQININMLITNVDVDTASSDSYTGFIDTDYYMLINPLKQFNIANMYLRNWDVYTNPSIIDQGTDFQYQNYVILQNGDTQEKSAYREYTEGVSDEIAKIYFRNSQYSLYTTRNYVSIGDFLAYVGGIFGSLYTIGYLFMSLYAYEQLWLKLFKVHYNLIADQKDCRTLGEIIKSKFAQNNILIPNMKSFLLIFTKQGLQNVKTYIQSQNIIMEDLSIVNYLKTVKDLQKIKKILFNDKQTQILDLYNKETIAMKDYQQQHSQKLEKGKKFLYGQHFQDHTLQVLRKIIDQYHNLLYDKDKFQLKITQRLIRIFDNDLQEVINTWENGYYQLKTMNTVNYDLMQSNRLAQQSQQFAIQKDITKIISYRNQYDFSETEIDSLLKTVLFKKQVFYIQDCLYIQYDCQIQDEERIVYQLTIHNKFQQYTIDIKQSDIVISHNFVARRHRIECNILKVNSLSIQDLINQSVEVTINNNFIIYLNCSLIVQTQCLEKLTTIPKDFRTQFQIFLDDHNREKYQILSNLLHQQRIKTHFVDNLEFFMCFDQNILGSQFIEIYSNWPNNELILNEEILTNSLCVQYLQILYDLTMSYLQNI